MEQCTSPQALRLSASLAHERHPPLKNRLPKVSVKILRNWLSAHSYHPYPSNTERAWLEARTGLAPSQIANSFSNARRRQRLARSSNSMPITAAQSVPDLPATSNCGRVAVRPQSCRSTASSTCYCTFRIAFSIIDELRLNWGLTWVILMISVTFAWRALP